MAQDRIVLASLFSQIAFLILCTNISMTKFFAHHLHNWCSFNFVRRCCKLAGTRVPVKTLPSLLEQGPLNVGAVDPAFLKTTITKNRSRQHRNHSTQTSNAQRFTKSRRKLPHPVSNSASCAKSVSILPHAAEAARARFRSKPRKEDGIFDDQYDWLRRIFNICAVILDRTSDGRIWTTLSVWSSVRIR